MDSIVQAVLEQSRQYADKIAIVYEDRRVTYGEFSKGILSFSNYLKQKKIKKGSRIAIEADDPILYYTVFLGVALNGCIVLPLENNISLYHLQEIVKQQNPALVFSKHTGENLLDFLDDGLSLPDQIVYPKSDNDAAIISTTGTTGKPVMIVHSNRSILATAENYVNGINVNENNVIYTSVPFHLAGGYRRILAALYCGATSVISHETLTLDALWNVIINEHVNFLCLVNANISVLLNGDTEQIQKIADHLLVVETYAGRLTSKMILEFYKLYSKSVLYNVYGTTESGCLLINNTKENSNDSCIGKPTIHSDIFLVDENDYFITEPGKYGYFAVRGPMNMKGYQRKKALTNQVVKNGILKINDIGYFDNSGYYYYVSRVGDIMNVNGCTFIPDDIEKIAIEHESIEDCACVGTEVACTGQLPVLYVVVNKKFNKKEFLDFLAENLESYKIPADVRIVNKIPRTTTGKIVRNVLSMLQEKSMKE